MNRNGLEFIKKTLFVILSVLIVSSTKAGTPLWTFSPLTSTTVIVPENGVGMVNYQVNNQSSRAKHLVLLPMQGISTGSVCNLSPKNQPGSSCLLSLVITGSDLPKSGIHGGPALCQANIDNSPNPNQCYQPTQANILNVSVVDVPPNTTLSISVNSLTLATQGIFTAASGAGNQVSKARKLIITNIGGATATGVNYSIVPALPAGTTISPASCGNILPGGTCELTITPGNTPSSIPTSAPVPSVLTVQGSNTLVPVSSNVVVLTYGNLFKGGLVFSIDDSTIDTTGVGGKVLTSSDQSAGIIWSTALDPIPGIDETSTIAIPSPALPIPNPNAFVGCAGNTDGLCNVGNIFKQYPLVNKSLYAAGLCDATINGFSDWYLPAICEMGYDGANVISTCGASTNPLLQNIYSNLEVPGFISLMNQYWSSTEDSQFPINIAWFQDFSTGDQLGVIKSQLRYVRCVRIFAP